MKTTDNVDLEVCVDCIMVIANGEATADTNTDEHVANMDAMWPAQDGWRLGYGNSDPDASDLGFSWGSCDGCGSNLGGDRFAAHAFKVVGR